MAAISDRKTIQKIAAHHASYPIQVSQWKRQLLDGATERFTRGKKSNGKDERQTKEAELFQQYCLAEPDGYARLQMELEWLKKV
jgi:hypothetical protein